MRTPRKPQPAGYVASRRPRGIPQRFTIRGDFRFELVGADGKTKDVREVRNLIVNGGLDFVKELLLDSVTPTTLATMTHIAIGSDATAETATDSALGAELARQAFDNYTAGGVGIASVDVTIPAGTGTGAIAEAGILDAPAAGNLLNRVTFAAVNKTASDALKVTFTLTIANA